MPIFDMNLHAIGVLALTVVSFVMFARGKVPIETTALLIMATLVAGFFVFPYATPGAEPIAPTSFFLGFGHEALVTICALMIMGRALMVTGALEPVANLMARALIASPKIALLGILVLCGLASGFINDTPVVMLMLPILMSVAVQSGTSPSKLLMPVNYAVLIGGMGTTIGTSTNLLVIAIAVDLGVRPFGMFDFFEMTLIAAGFGVLYLWLVLPWLLPDRGSPLGDAKPKLYGAILTVNEGGFCDGTMFKEIIRRASPDVEIQRITRGKEVELARLPSLKLQAGDRLQVMAPGRMLPELKKLLGTSLSQRHRDEVDDETPSDDPELKEELAEVVVTDGSSIHNRTVKSLRLSDEFDIVIVALHRVALKDNPDRLSIHDLPLQVGDVLLVQGTHEQIHALRDRTGVLVLASRFEEKATEKAPWALGIFGITIALAATKIMPIAIASFIGVTLMLLTRCLGWRDIAPGLSAKVIMLVVASLALGKALVDTGATQALAASFLIATQNASPQTILLLLMGLMTLFTNFVSNNAAAAIGTPIAIDIARTLGVSPEPFVLAILFGANFCYLTPMAYQTNLLIMTPGGYRFSDYLRAGLPLTIIMLGAYSYLLPRYFPL